MAMSSKGLSRTSGEDQSLSRSFWSNAFHERIIVRRVLYVGTATYNLKVCREQQTRCFVDQGFTVDSLDKAMNDSEQDRAVCVSKIETANVIVVGGGNTLFAVDRWKHLGLVPHFRKAMERNCVLTGGSDGAIFWFDSGHSNSADPDMYLAPQTATLDEIPSKPTQLK